ncbi:Putative RNA-binding protein eif1ad [Chamberlinius hualienensis]
MSSVKKQKHVASDFSEEIISIEDKQRIVKIVCGRGNNLHQVTDGLEETWLVSMPVKFRRNCWVKRGDFVIVEPIEEGDKVKAEIVRILYKEQIQQLKKQNLWPSQFDDMKSEKHSLNVEEPCETFKDECDDESGDDDNDLFVNTNRAVVEYDYESDSE